MVLWMCVLSSSQKEISFVREKVNGQIMSGNIHYPLSGLEGLLKIHINYTYER